MWFISKLWGWYKKKAYGSSTALDGDFEEDGGGALPLSPFETRRGAAATFLVSEL